MRFHVLGGQVCRIEQDGAPTVLPLNARETWLAVTFLLEGRVMAHQARRILNITDDNLRTHMSRLRKHGLLNSSRRGQYELTTEVEVDALDLIDLFRRSQTDQAGRTVLLRQGRALWAGGLPRPDGLPTPAMEVYAEVERAHRECMSKGRRLLIVDDRIAEDLAEKLRADHDCETAASFAEFLTVQPRLQEFDLVVVDRHLKPKYLDGQGLDIVRRINELPYAVPVMMMTYRPAPESSLSADEREYGLAACISKSADGEDAYIEPLARRINETLQDDPVAMSCENINSGMVSARRRATKDLEHRLGGRELQDKLGELDSAARRVEVRTRVKQFGKTFR
ncbi:MAG: hypothetical protein KDB63_07660 [Nocardioidaceae bacterium]|nr:hypothetical protein [Nocardioidaceae bacterium]